MQLITEHGFHATPMSMIARHAGVAAGTIYNYFPSKEVLIKQLYEELRLEMDRTLHQNDSLSGNIRERFLQLYRNLFQYFTQQPEAFLFLEQYANSPLILQHTKENELNKPLRDFLEEGMELGVLRSLEKTLMVAIVYGHAVSTAKLQLNGKLLLSEEQLAQAAQSCWDSVKIT